MKIYRTKKLDYGYKEKVSVYSHGIKYEGDSVGAMHRKKYIEMSDMEKDKSDERRLRYYRSKVMQLTEIAMMNTDLNVGITLTFRESITSYDMALAMWQSFLKRLRHTYGKGLKYICVWEYQQKRAEKEGIESGGVFHFHALMNTGYIEHAQLEGIWGNGFVWIEKLGNDAQRKKMIMYTLKYCTKEIASRIERGEDIRGQRFCFTSNNLSKPIKTVIDERMDLQDVIIEHMEDMIVDGSYDIRNNTGKCINHVDYVEYKK